MASRTIDVCIPELQERFAAFAVKMAETGIPFMLTCTKRTQEEQNDLYARGRTKPGAKVTWTRKSKHIEGRAFDIAILRDGQPVWDMKADVNHDAVPDYEQAGVIGESVGLGWGGRFKNPDRPHFELSGKVG
ncbi:MAG: M15 family metallopeptidase [Syntrophales bacterium]|jgi:peptidoglycan L-alanyl-D-glutamate endopeptidase CwlK|nr:M15 family metallopeptidase [Syntrophales bacterium]